MSNKTRKALWPVALALAVVAIGAMALAIGFAGGPGTAQAHGGSGHDASSCATDQSASFHDLLRGNPPCLPAPTGVAGTPTMDSVMLTWDAVTDAESYILERKTGSAAYGNSMTATSNSATVSGLTAATSYTFRVRANSAANGEGRWSDDTVSGATIMTMAAGNGNGNGSDDNRGSATKPSAPALMSISRATDRQARPVLPGDGKLMIEWGYPNDGGSPITGFDVQYTMTPADDDSWQSITDLPANNRSYVLTGLANGETYHVEVRAKNRLGNSSWSASRSGMPVATPSMPMELSVADHHFPGIVVSWDAPASGGDHPIDQYNWDVDDMAANGSDSYGTFGSRALRDPTPPRMQMFFPERGGAITTSVAGDDDGCLKVTVSASNATGPDSESSSRTRTLPGDEAMVTCASAPMLTKQMVDNVVILRWSKPANLGGGTEVTEYVVRRWGYERISPNHDDTPGPYLPAEYREWHLDGSEMSMWDTGLSHQTIYRYRIYAITDRYDLGYEWNRYDVSEAVTAFTSTDGGLILAPPTPPSAPRMLEAMDQCADQISLSWMEPSNFGGGVDVDRNRHWSHGMIVVEDDAIIESYQAQYRVRGSSSWMDLTVTGTSAVVTSGLEYGKTYDFRVRAKNDIGLYGPWAMTSMMLVEPNDVNRPQNLRATVNDEGNVLLQWTAPIGGNDKWYTGDDEDETVNNGDLSKRLSYRVERISTAEPISEQAHRYGPRSFVTGTNPTRVTHEQTYTDDEVDSAANSATYVVYAIVDACQLSEGNSVTLNIATTAPGMPIGLEADPDGDRVDLSWTAPTDPGARGDVRARVTSYQIERHSGDGNFSIIVEANATTTYSDTDVTAGTTYTYRVSATNNFGKTGAASAIATATPQMLVLGTPSITAASNAAGSATITLTPAANATKHFVWAFRVGGTDNATDGMWSGQAAGDATSVTMTGLTSGASYWFIAIAGRGDGAQTTWSTWSSWTAPVSIQ